MSETMGQRALFATRAKKCAKVGGAVLLGANWLKACACEMEWPFWERYGIFLRVCTVCSILPNPAIVVVSVVDDHLHDSPL